MDAEITFPMSANVSDIRRILNMNRCRVMTESSCIEDTVVLCVKSRSSSNKVSELVMPRAYGFHFRRLSIEIHYLLDNFSRVKQSKLATLYLVQVLAATIQEIRAAQPRMSHTWRSPTLHPVLWRNYLGFQHSEEARIGFRVYCTTTDTNFQGDPLQLSGFYSFFVRLINI